MKKYIILFMACSLLLCFVTGCADVLESGLEIVSMDEEKTDFSIQDAETLLYKEGGYFVAEGNLCEMGKDTFWLEMNDGQKICFKFSPETIIYTGEDREIAEGQSVKVVFDGEVGEEEMRNVSVIAISTLEKEY